MSKPDQTFTATPKVLVERLSLQERRLTDGVQYRQAFTGPIGSRGTISRGQFSRDADEETDATLLPMRYWYATGRDAPMETEVARGLLPSAVSHADAVFNSARTALLVAALTGDVPLDVLVAASDEIDPEVLADSIIEEWVGE